MSKELNEAIIDSLAGEFSAVDSCVLIGPRALTVAEASGLRDRLREKEVRLRVVKNSLAAIALERTTMPGLGKLLDGPSAVVYGGDGALSISKLLVEERKRVADKIVIHGGFFEGELLDADGIEQLSKAPSREQSLAMVMSGFFGPVDELSRGMNNLLTEMHGLMEALSKERGEAEG